MKIFEKYNFYVKGNILSIDDFRLAREKEEPKINTDSVTGILKGAEDDLSAEIPAILLSHYRAYQEIGSTVVYSTPYRRRMQMLFRMSVAEKVENSGRFIDKIADVIWAMLDESTWMLPEHTPHSVTEAPKGSKVPGAVGDKYGHGLELGAAYRGATMALAYHWHKDKLAEISPLLTERIVYELKNRIIAPFLNHTFRWEGVGGNKVNNWCPWIVSNVLLTVALVEEDIEKREKSVELAMKYVDNFFNSYGADGGCEEGPTYWNAASGCMFDSLELIEDMSDGKFTVYHEPLVKAMGEYAPRANVKDRYFVNFADSGSTCAFDGNMLIRFGEKCGSDILISFGENMLRMVGINPDTALICRTFRTITSKTVDTSKTKAKAATDTYFPDLKVMILRDSEDPGEGSFLAIKGGHNEEMHNHNDVGSFIAYKNGEPVVIDAGVGTYTKQTFSKDRYKIWSMQSLYHNVASFGGVGQKAGRRYASKNEIYDKDARSLTLDITDAYPEEAGLESYVRCASLNNGVISLTDKIKTKSDTEIDFIFMAHREPKLTNPGEIQLNAGCVLSYSTDLCPEIETFDPVGMDTNRLWGTDKLYRIHLKTTAKECEYTFTVR